MLPSTYMTPALTFVEHAHKEFLRYTATISTDPLRSALQGESAGKRGAKSQPLTSRTSPLSRGVELWRSFEFAAYLPILLWWYSLVQCEKPVKRRFSEAPVSEQQIENVVKFVSTNPSFDIGEQVSRQVGALFDGSAAADDAQQARGGEGERMVALFAHACHNCLAFRDAILLCNFTSMTFEQLVDVAFTPHAPASQQAITEHLTAALKKPQEYLLCRASRAVSFLLCALQQLEGADRVQPLAMSSYLLWWGGRVAESTALAFRALDLDPQCSLARIVVKANEARVLAHWKSEPHWPVA